MDIAPVSVTRTLTLELIDATGAATPLAAELLYDKSDPYAVAACFRTGLDLPVRWVFARDLLAEGLYEPTGDGDVHVWPCLDPTRTRRRHHRAVVARWRGTSAGEQRRGRASSCCAPRPSFPVGHRRGPSRRRGRTRPSAQLSQDPLHDPRLG
ncbi:MAG: SsgA family sporulation/cell division regulator [Nocardioidaceae bacterium]